MLCDVLSLLEGVAAGIGTAIGAVRSDLYAAGVAAVVHGVMAASLDLTLYSRNFASAVFAHFNFSF